MRKGSRYFTQTEMHLLLLILFFVFVARTFDLAVDTCLKSTKFVIRFHLKALHFSLVISQVPRITFVVQGSPAKTLHCTVFVAGRKSESIKATEKEECKQRKLSARLKKVTFSEMLNSCKVLHRLSLFPCHRGITIHSATASRREPLYMNRCFLQTRKQM